MEGLYVVTVEALPAAGSGAFALHGGAYINVFTTDATELQARDTVSREVADAGWKIQSIGNIDWVTRADYADDPSSLEHFEQALIAGVVLVIHTFPPGPDEQDVVH